GRHLRRIWSALSRSLEIGGTGAAPRQHISIGIRDGYQSIIECRLNVCSPARHRLPLALALAPYGPLRSFLRHAYWFPFPGLRHPGGAGLSSLSPGAYFFAAFFLPATVFFAPRRVRALVRVRCPCTGRFLRWRMPR